jgi:uncharacterized membrane protein YfcA
MAAGTSLAVITMNSATGAVGQLSYISFNWYLVAGFLAFALAGMLIGTALANRLADYVLRRLFACAVVAVAAVIAVGNLLTGV